MSIERLNSNTRVDRNITRNNIFLCWYCDWDVEIFRDTVWRVIGISGYLMCSETLMELIFNPCREIRWSPEGPVSQIHTSPSRWFPLWSFPIFQVLGCARQPHLFIPSKTATLVPEFAVEDLPLSRTAAFVPAFAVKGLSLGRTLMMMMMMMMSV